MKTNAKRTVFFSAVALVCGAVFVFSACGEAGDGGGKVSDSEWAEKLDIRTENYESYSIQTEQYPAYGKERAEEYGEWEMRSSDCKVDTVNGIVYSRFVEETYDPEDENAVDGFVKTEFYGYTLSYFGKYYSYSFEVGSSASVSDAERVSEITKADYIEEIDIVKNQVDSFTMTANLYKMPEMKALFDYDDETKLYEFQSGGLYLAFRFYGNGVMMRTKPTSIAVIDLTVSGFNATVVTVPSYVTDAIAAYREKNASESN